MVDLNEIWDLEKRCWIEGQSFYRDIITEDSTYAFPPPMGIFKGAAFVDQMGENGPCVDVTFENQHAQTLENCVVLIYLGIGKTADGNTRRSHCTTVWAKQTGAWKLITHHQTPIAK